ncbi:MAG: hypothetical protein IPM53_17960 [Anaerolineaceae bacterium]|nr:hypothetical protein [Anaerolineaceae bacterium]
MSAENFSSKPEQIPDSEFVNQLKDQLRATWEKLPDGEKATMAIELLKDMEEVERLSFRETLDARWPITSESVPATFALINITPDDLEQIGLDEEEIEFFDESKLQEMSTEIRDHYVVQGFWEELKYHTNHFLGGLRKQNQK